MTICRAIHNKNYTVVNNHICTDNRLSWKAKGIWLYAFSRPDDWQFYSKDIISHSTDGKDSVYAGLKELEDTGYLLRIQPKTEDGKFLPWEWQFHEAPQEIQKMLPQTGFPEAVKPVAGKPPLLSTDLPSTEKIDCKRGKPREASSSDSDSKTEPRKTEADCYKTFADIPMQFFVQGIDGKPKKCNRDDIITRCVKQNIKIEEFRDGIVALLNHKGPISDWIAYVLAIINKNRNIRAAEMLNKRSYANTENSIPKRLIPSLMSRERAEENGRR